MSRANDLPELGASCQAKPEKRATTGMPARGRCFQQASWLSTAFPPKEKDLTPFRTMLSPLKALCRPATNWLRSLRPRRSSYRSH